MVWPLTYFILNSSADLTWIGALTYTCRVVKQPRASTYVQNKQRSTDLHMTNSCELQNIQLGLQMRNVLAVTYLIFAYGMFIK